MSAYLNSPSAFLPLLETFGQARQNQTNYYRPMIVDPNKEANVTFLQYKPQIGYLSKPSSTSVLGYTSSVVNETTTFSKENNQDLGAYQSLTSEAYQPFTSEAYQPYASEAYQPYAPEAYSSTETVVSQNLQYQLPNSTSTKPDPQEEEQNVDAYSPFAYQPTNLVSNPVETDTTIPKQQENQISAPINAPKDRNWNAELQNILKVGCEDLRTFMKLEQLANDFAFAATTFATIIISELCVPYEQKTIKPVSMGGMAGGEKYLAQGIVFKFALDMLISESPKMWMYGGTQARDDYAIKAAAAELNGLKSYFTTHVFELHYPLMALIDYKGFRVIAISVLPIAKDTIRYGSADAGRTVHADDPELNDLMEEAGKILNLKPHLVGNVNKKTLYAPGDIEGHIGLDGNYYVIDFGRTMPPEAPPLENIKDGESDRYVFWKFLRPEWVREQPFPLCSDAYTAWDQSSSEDIKINQLEIREATQRLYSQKIPTMAATLADLVASTYFCKIKEYQHESASKRYQAQKQKTKLYLSFVNPGWLHNEGMNIRHMGRLRSYLKDQKSRKLVLSVCTARVAKEMIKLRMRGTMRSLSVPCEEPFKLIVVQFFNTFLLGRQTPSQPDVHTTQQFFRFWGETLKERFKRHFPKLLSDAEIAEIEKDTSSEETFKPEDKQTFPYLKRNLSIRLVVYHLLRDLRLKLKRNAKKDFLLCPKGFFFTTGDIKSIQAKVHHFHLVYVARGYTTQLLADDLLAAKAPPREIKRLLKKANRDISKIYHILPRCPIAAHEFARNSSLLSHYLNKPEKVIEALQQASRFYEICLSSSAEVWDNVHVIFSRWATCLNRLAHFKEKAGDHEAARQHRLEAEEKVKMASSFANKHEGSTSGSQMCCVSTSQPSFNLVKFKVRTMNEKQYEKDQRKLRKSTSLSLGSQRQKQTQPPEKSPLKHTGSSVALIEMSRPLTRTHSKRKEVLGVLGLKVLQDQQRC